VSPNLTLKWFKEYPTIAYGKDRSCVFSFSNERGQIKRRKQKLHFADDPVPNHSKSSFTGFACWCCIRFQVSANIPMLPMPSQFSYIFVLFVSSFNWRQNDSFLSSLSVYPLLSFHKQGAHVPDILVQRQRPNHCCSWGIPNTSFTRQHCSACHDMSWPSK
jgi:hypothetical protein